MADLFESLKKLCNSDDYVKDVYSCTGSSEMEGLLDDVRDTKFPCVMMEVGDDGFFNMLDSFSDSRMVVFYVLESNSKAKATEIQAMLNRTKSKGIEILRKIRVATTDPNDEWFGVDFARIDYFKVGPLGMGAYGYCFNLNIVEYGE